MTIDNCDRKILMTSSSHLLIVGSKLQTRWQENISISENKLNKGSWKPPTRRWQIPGNLNKQMDLFCKQNSLQNHHMIFYTSTLPRSPNPPTSSKWMHPVNNLPISCPWWTTDADVHRSTTLSWSVKDLDSRTRCDFLHLDFFPVEEVSGGLRTGWWQPTRTLYWPIASNAGNASPSPKQHNNPPFRGFLGLSRKPAFPSFIVLLHMCSGAEMIEGAASPNFPWNDTYIVSYKREQFCDVPKPKVLEGGQWLERRHLTGKG